MIYIMRLTALTFLGAILSISQCSQTDTRPPPDKKTAIRNFDKFPLTVNLDSVVICWDSPSENTDSVDYYELFWRNEKDSGWTIMKRDIPAVDSPYVVVYRNEIESNDSIFYFAVRSVSKNGMKSDFHFSSDSTAGGEGDGKGPWYLRWPKR